jgi:hypothetical protein
MTAAVAYELAGYQANASCIARIVTKQRGGEIAGLEDLAAAFVERKFLLVPDAAELFLREPRKWRRGPRRISLS